MYAFEEVVERARLYLLNIPGVVGVSGRGGVIRVYVESEDAVLRVPREFMGYPVEVVVVGRIRLF